MPTAMGNGCNTFRVCMDESFPCREETGCSHIRDTMPGLKTDPVYFAWSRDDLYLDENLLCKKETGCLHSRNAGGAGAGLCCLRPPWSGVVVVFCSGPESVPELDGRKHISLGSENGVNLTTKSNAKSRYIQGDRKLMIQNKTTHVQSHLIII